MNACGDVPAYAHGIGPTPLLGRTIGQDLRRAVDRWPQREAVVVRHQDVRLTFAQLWDATTQAARALLALGVECGDRVGIWSTNRFEWVVLQYATARIGAILVNVNPAYQAAELAYALKQSGVSVLFHGPAFKGQPYAPLLGQARPECPALRVVVAIETEWSAFLREGDRIAMATLERREADLHWDDPINIQYTSGTTGFPKGATLTHHNILNNGFTTGELLHYTEDDRVAVPVPFYHCFGMVLGNLATLSHGGCVVVPSETFSADATWQTVLAEHCTSLYGVPTMFRMLRELPSFRPRASASLRTGIMAGAPCPMDLMQQIVDEFPMPEVAIGYGMTETSPISTLTRSDDSLACRVGTVGRAIPHVEIQIVAANGRVCRRGEIGEFRARGYHVMLGYWDDASATRLAIDSAGWMHSGDLASMDEAGYVRITGRIKDLIIRGGENIDPRKVEVAVEAHPCVAECYVIGVPSRKYGEEVMAWVRPCPGASVSESELTAWCRDRLAAFKSPRYWRFVDAFPLTVTGKVQKYRLRELAVEALGLQNE